MKKTMIASVVGIACAFGAGSALAAPPADWSAVKATEITLFYPGATPMEWVLNGRTHGGARAYTRAGDSCAMCHHEETADMGALLVSGEKAEPTPIPGKVGSIPVKVRAARDGDHLYLNFTWKQPPASGAPKMDEANPVKIAYMLEDGGKIDGADRNGCWATCHEDSQSMPEGEDGKKKYVKDGSLADGVFYDIAQWRSGQNDIRDGHIAETRVMEGGQALVGAEGKLDGDMWSVTFTRKLAGGEGDVTLKAGNSYHFGFAIHDDHANYRFHHVSLGYKLEIGADSAQISLLDH